MGVLIELVTIKFCCFFQAAFLLPVLTGILRNGIEGSKFLEAQEPQAIVIGPTRELVVQIYNEARKYSYGTVVRPVVVYGGTSVGHQARQLEQGSHIVIGTPGRLLDFVGKGKVRMHVDCECNICNKSAIKLWFHRPD